MENALEKYMKIHNLSKTELSRMCDVSVYIINKILQGERGVNGIYYYKICKVTKIKPDTLLGL